MSLARLGTLGGPSRLLRCSKGRSDVLHLILQKQPREVQMIPFEKFTEQARMALARAQELLARLQHNALDTEHLLFVLLGQADGLVAEGLGKLGFDRRPVLARLQQDLSRRPTAAQTGSLY